MTRARELAFFFSKHVDRDAGGVLSLLYLHPRRGRLEVTLLPLFLVLFGFPPVFCGIALFTPYCVCCAVECMWMEVIGAGEFDQHPDTDQNAPPKDFWHPDLFIPLSKCFTVPLMFLGFLYLPWWRYAKFFYISWEILFWDQGGNRQSWDWNGENVLSLDCCALDRK